MTESLGGKLYITSPEEAMRVFVIEQPVVRIGREPPPHNDLVLQHGWVSRTHACIYCDHLPYRIQDLRSSNGTAVNDEPLPSDEIRALRDNDVIAIGPFRLQFEAPPERSEGEMAAEARAPSLGVRAMPRPGAPVPPEPPSAAESVSIPSYRWVGMPEARSRWLQYLPPIYGDNEFLSRFLLLFEDLLGPVEQAIKHFDLFLSPDTAPDSFLPWLSEWLGEIAEEKWPSDIRRELLRNAIWLYQARGTRSGLARHLRICTECDVDIVENADGPHSFRVVLHSEGRPTDRRAIERIIDANRPAHTRYTLEVT